MAAPKGWHSRGYLPHLDHPGLVQFVTFRLEDSLPAAVLRRISAEIGDDDAEQYRRTERYLDAGHGACWLRRPEIATLVQDALLHFDGARYRLLAWVVMPNHVHALVGTAPNFPLPGVVQSWKGFTARAANTLLGRKREFWHRDYYDRYIRDDTHLAAVVRYIDENPVKAQLVRTAQDWPYSSASHR